MVEGLDPLCTITFARVPVIRDPGETGGSGKVGCRPLIIFPQERWPWARDWCN